MAVRSDLTAKISLVFSDLSLSSTAPTPISATLSCHFQAENGYREVRLMMMVTSVGVGSQIDTGIVRILREKFGVVSVCFADSGHVGGRNLYRRLRLFEANTFCPSYSELDEL